MGITVKILYIPDGTEELCSKILFNVAGSTNNGGLLQWYNENGSPVFSIMLSEFVSVDYYSEER